MGSGLITLKGGRVPPTEFRLVPMGAYQTTKGTFFLTPENARRIMSQLEDEGVDVMMDWEHASVASSEPGRADAAGWFNVELRDDGLYATNVKWTEDAAAALEAAQYRYFSPAFTVDEETNEIIKFINCALTNRPATKNAQPLVAASKTAPSPEGKPMHKKFLSALAQHMKANKLDHPAATKACGVDTAKMFAEGAEAPSQEEMAKCSKGLGFKVDPDKDEDDETETASALNNHDVDQTKNTGAEDSDAGAPGGDKDTDVDASDTVNVPGEDKFEKLSKKELIEALVTLTGTTTLTKAKGVVAGQKATVMAYNDAVKKLLSERATEKREALVTLGKAQNKLTPGLIKLYSTKPVEEFEAFLECAPVITGEEFRQPESGKVVALLKREDREVATLLNRDPEEVAQLIEDERSGKMARQILASYYETPKKASK